MERQDKQHLKCEKGGMLNQLSTGFPSAKLFSWTGDELIKKHGGRTTERELESKCCHRFFGAIPGPNPSHVAVVLLSLHVSPLQAPWGTDLPPFACKK